MEEGSKFMLYISLFQKFVEKKDFTKINKYMKSMKNQKSVLLKKFFWINHRFMMFII